MAAAPSMAMSNDVLLVEPQHESSVNDFFIRAGLTPQDRLDCYNFIERLYPAISWKQAPCQGYCSLTIFVNGDVVIQFRPDNYRLDVQMIEAAREVYGSFVPDTKYLATLPGSGLHVYAMNRITGASLKFLRKMPAESYNLEHRARLCVDFAVFMSRAWHYGSIEKIPLGLVGRSIVSRLQCLSTELPVRFRPVAEQLLKHIPLIEALPWVLSHGDIVPGNIIVNPTSGELLGFVDWAEAERLPFGICLYGLEEILGQMTASGFRYDIRANELRGIFWDKLKSCIPELLQPANLKAVKLARDLGVLLWHGIAFDNGAIDRVVQEGKDVDEIRRLDAFLELPDGKRYEERKA